MIKSFTHNERGGVAVLFGLSLLPLTMAIGVAVDYSMVTRTKATLQANLDAATLATAQIIAANASSRNGNSNNSGSGNSNPNGQGNNGNHGDQSAATAIFSREINSRRGGLSPAIIIAQSANLSGGNISTTVQSSITASVPAYFGGIMGYRSYPVTVTSTASKGGIVYSNISIALDVSPSMAIAATAAGITRLRALTLAQTGTACAFACHDDGAPTSNYTIARNGGVDLRIDVVKSASQTLVNSISSVAATPNQYTISVHTIGSKMTTVVTPTTSSNTVSNAISAVDFDRMSVIVPTLPALAAANIASGDSINHYADSDFGTTLPALSAAIPDSGSGSDPSSRQQYVFIVTDGLSSVGTLYNPGVNSTYAYPAIPNFTSGNDAGKLTRPLDPALCASFKSRGVQVAVIQVTYVPDPTEYWYQKLVQSNAPPAAIESSLRACASADLFYQANDSANIATGMTTLFQTIRNRSLRLTN